MNQANRRRQRVRAVCARSRSSLELRSPSCPRAARFYEPERFKQVAAFGIPGRLHQGKPTELDAASGSTGCCWRRPTRRKSPGAWAGFTRTAKSTSPRPEDSERCYAEYIADADAAPAAQASSSRARM